MLTIVFNSDVYVCISQTIAATIIILGTHMHLYDLQQLHHKYVTLTYMSWLTDFGVCHCFEGIFLVLMDNFETREFILGQIAYTLKFSSCNASMQLPVSLTFIHGPVILPYISSTV